MVDLTKMECAICGRRCGEDHYCAGCESFICERHVYSPGSVTHRPSEHDESGD